MFAFFSPFPPPGLRPGGGKGEKTAKRTGAAAVLVAKQSLRWGRPSGGGTKSTNRKPGGVVCFTLCVAKSQPRVRLASSVVLAATTENREDDLHFLPDDGHFIMGKHANPLTVENTLESQSSAPAAPAVPADLTTGQEILLADGAVQRLEGLSRDELLALQWAQERQFAAQILAAPKGSTLRSQTTRQAYDSVTKILAAARNHQHVPLVMGLHPRHVRLVLDLLRRQRRRGLRRAVLRNRLRRRDAPGAGPQRGIPLRRNRGLGGHASDGRRATGAGGPAATPRGQFPRRHRRPTAVPGAWSTGTTSSSTFRPTKSATGLRGSTPCSRRADSC